MGQDQKQHAWLEGLESGMVPIEGSCSVGRAPSNVIVLPGEGVSRRHAIIHAQTLNEYWLVDLGSVNGTYLNGRRLAEPTPLCDADQIDIGKFHLTFRLGLVAATAASGPQLGDATIPDMRRVRCWLLVTDIVGSTRLGLSLPADQLSMLTGSWLERCRRIVDETGGTIDKFLGDGLLAYWPDRPHQSITVACALSRFRELQACKSPAFRLVLHLGEVFTSGLVSFGREGLWGNEVGFVFAMEKLASSLGEETLLSAAATAALGPCLTAAEAGSHALPGHDGQFMFWRFVGSHPLSGGPSVADQLRPEG